MKFWFKIMFAVKEEQKMFSHESHAKDKQDLREEKIKEPTHNIQWYTQDMKLYHIQFYIFLRSSNKEFIILQEEWKSLLKKNPNLTERLDKIVIRIINNGFCWTAFPIAQAHLVVSSA